MIKIALILAFIIMLQHFVVAQNEEYDPNWCKLEAEFGPENCPIQRGDYDRCVTCTSTYFYSCGKFKKNPKVWTFKDFIYICFVHMKYFDFSKDIFRVLASL